MNLTIDIPAEVVDLLVESVQKSMAAERRKMERFGHNQGAAFETARHRWALYLSVEDAVREAQAAAYVKDE